MVRRWFQRGMRPRMVKDQRYRSAYIFGAVCPARDTGAALVLTHVSVAAMNLLLEEVASQVPAGTHAAMLIDNAGWHTANDLRVPSNITLVHRRRGLSGAEDGCRRRPHRHVDDGDRPPLRQAQIRRAAEALDRRAHHRMDQSQPPSRAISSGTAASPPPSSAWP
jgi:hypothetical protein